LAFKPEKTELSEKSFRVICERPVSLFINVFEIIFFFIISISSVKERTTSQVQSLENLTWFFPKHSRKK
jgi:hypothetical protein